MMRLGACFANFLQNRLQPVYVTNLSLLLSQAEDLDSLNRYASIARGSVSDLCINWFLCHGFQHPLAGQAFL